MDLIEIFGGRDLLGKPEYGDFYVALKEAQKITQADARIRSLSFKDGKAVVSLSASYKALMPAICEYCGVKDDGGVGHGYTFTSSFDSHTLSHVHTYDKAFVNGEKAEASAMFAFIDDEGKIFYTEANYTAKYFSHPVITDAVVADPKSLNGKETVVSYARIPYIGELIFDYHYSNNRGGKEGVKILLPFSGSFKVSSDWEILGLETSVEPAPQMELTLVNGGVAYGYNQDLAVKIKIDKVTNTVSWNLEKDSGEDDWNTYMDTTEFGTNTVGEFYACFSVALRNIADPQDYYSPVFTVESRAKDTAVGNTVVPVKPIHIYMGCFAEDTKIRMADLSEKPIKDIKPGDTVKTENGSTVVTDTITGPEEILFKIETEEGSILLTSSHPVKTPGGYVRVDGLKCGTPVILNDREAEIKFIYPERYDGTVYNLVLDEPCGIYANGFLTGDFTMQNELPEEPPMYMLKNSVASVVNQFRDLYEKIKKI